LDRIGVSFAAMSKVNLDSYFARIGYTGQSEPSLDTLRALCALHPIAIPFENLDVIRGLGVRLDLPSVEQKLVSDRRGGYCFEQNGLFAAVLEGLGFRVTRLAARVRWQVPAEVHMPLTHMLLRVDLQDLPWLADVGFGGLTPTALLRLDVTDPQPTPHETFRIVRDGAGHMLQAQLANEWNDVYQFIPEPQHPIDYEVANWFTSSHPTSRFVQNLIVSRAGYNRERVSLMNRELVIRRENKTEKRPIDTPEELLRVLADQFGLCFPSGTGFGAPGGAWPS
jgi:N-hydroxyarylamine O-acetyltransferase